MALPTLFRIRTPNTCNAWGYEFEWTSDHITSAQAEKLKHSYDFLAEECLERLDAISPPAHAGTLPRNSNSNSNSSTTTNNNISSSQSETTFIPNNEKPPSQTPNRDLYALLATHHATDPKLTELWRQIHHIPPWVDWAQIARGQDVFYRYSGPVMSGLTFQSLLGGMGAARVVETLARTGGFNVKVARGRLFETTQHILQCTRTLEGVQPGGEGFQSSVRVRLLHAAVRRRILALEKARPGYYRVGEWGVPINDLDQIATIGSFSAALIWLSLPRQGIMLRESEIDDYLALWRWIAYLLGTPDEWFTTRARHKAAMESLIYNEMKPSDTSRTMANNIIFALKEEPPMYVSAEMLTASARWLNGNKLSDHLGLPQVSLYYWALMAGQCLFFMFMCYGYRAVDAWDRAHLARVKKVFWDVIVKAKWGLADIETKFEFKYVPEYDTLTELGKRGESKLKNSGIERRNLRAFMIGAGVLMGVGVTGIWLTVRAAVRLVRVVL